MSPAPPPKTPDDATLPVMHYGRGLTLPPVTLRGAVLFLVVAIVSTVTLAAVEGGAPKLARWTAALAFADERHWSRGVVMVAIKIAAWTALPLIGWALARRYASTALLYGSLAGTWVALAAEFRIMRLFW